MWSPVLALVLLLAPGVSPTDQPRALSFQAAMASVGTTVQVRSASDAAEVSGKGARAQPRVTSNPVVSAAVGARVTPGDEQGLEGTIGISQPISVRRYVRHSREALQAETRWRVARIDEARLGQQLTVARAWLELRRAEEQHALAVEQVGVEQARVETLQRLVAAQERNAGDRVDAEAELERARLQVLDAEGAQVDAGYALAQALGRVDTEPLETVGVTPEPGVPSPLEQVALVRDVASLPSARAARLLAAAESVRGQEAWASAGPKVSVGLQAQRESQGSTIVQGTVSVPIPAVRRGHRQRVAHAATAAALQGEAEVEVTALRGTVLRAVHELEHTQRVHEQLETVLLPAGVRAVELREREAELGEALQIEVLDARRRAFELRGRWIDARIDRAWAQTLVALLAAASERGAL